ncbi:MAG: hypothetical protein LBO74_01075 [Candidatus Symbiothrix sp.]|jgi:hypothetical protein|nr:hypothetical protein [Candidatus Symbiothrix sp.]
MTKNDFISVGLFLIIGLTNVTFCSCNISNSDMDGKSTSVTDESVKECLKDFDFLVEKIQTNYPGYMDKVTNENRSQLTEIEKVVRKKITNNPDSCRFYLNEYADFFKDHHLGVIRNWSDTTENHQKLDIMDISTYGKNLYINIDSVQQATKNAKSIEGVWIASQREFIVAKDGKKYVGVIVNQKDWKNGQVIYEFEPVNDTVFNVINYSLIKDRKPHKTEASLHVNGKLIEFQNDRKFVRKSDSPIFDEAFRTSYEDYYPNVSFVAMNLDTNTFFLRIPTFADNTANELVTKHWKEIMSCPNLIIDIRYNGGGNDESYRELAKIIYTKPYELTGVEYYATEDNIKYFEEDIRNGNIREEWIKLTEAMKKNIGSFVTPPWRVGNNTVRKNTVYPVPRNVGIIINERNASSAEQFLLAAKESNKVILFGNTNTAGVFRLFKC